MEILSIGDYVIVASFLIVTTVVGLWMSRKAAASIENYFLGGRSLPWYLLGIAGMANWFDLTGTMVITSFLYMLGPRGLYIEFRGGAVLLLPFLLAYAGKWHRRSGCMTGANWMTFRFGEGRAAEALRFATALIGIITAVMLLAYLIKGAMLFFGTFFPFPPRESVCVFLLITTLYVTSSGFYGVVLTDVLQSAILIFCCLVVASMAWLSFPDADHLRTLAYHVTQNTSWTSSVPSLHTEMPPSYAAYQPLLLISTFYFLRSTIGGMGSGAESRYFGARSDRDCGLQSALQGGMIMFRWPLMIGFAILGLHLIEGLNVEPANMTKAVTLVRQYHPEVRADDWNEMAATIARTPAAQPPDLVSSLASLLGPDWQKELPLLGYDGAIDPEEILPAVLLSCPHLLKGLLLVGMLAAMMSAKNGVVNPTSALFVKDIYQNFLRPRAGNHELILVSYTSTLAIIGVAFYFGSTAASINDIWGWFIMSLTAGGLAPGMLRLYWWRCNAWGMFGGMLLGAAGAIVQRIVDPAMPEIEQFICMTSLSFAGTIAGSLLTRPTPLPIVRDFYLKTRPFGLWKPFSADLKPTWKREHRNDILTVPFALIAQVMLFLIPMELVVKSYSSLIVTLPLFAVGLSGLYHFWWKPLHSPASDGE